MRCRPFAIIALVIAACSGQEAGTDDVCGLAAEHVASCLGTEPVAIGAACEGDAADLAGQTLTTSCDELKSDDKGDGQSNGLATLACISLGAPIFAHGLEENELCCFDYNCEGALVCRKFSCEKKSALGGPCERENHCEGDLGCNADRCVAKVAAGGRCDRTAACQEDLVCNGGRCKAPAADGAACTADEHCASWHCLGKRCVSPSPEGGVCGGTRGICDAGLACVDGTCREPEASGLACDRSDFFACENGETCWESVCVRRHEEGGPCERLFDCGFGLFCRNRVCAP